MWSRLSGNECTRKMCDLEDADWMLLRAAGIEHNIRPLGERGPEGDRERNQERNWKSREGAGPREPLDPRGRAGRGQERNDGVGARMQFFSARYPGPSDPASCFSSHCPPGKLSASVSHGGCLASVSSHPGGRVGCVSHLWPSCSQVPELGQKLNRLRMG